MKGIGKIILFGVALWFAVLAVAMMLFQIRQEQPIFFETLITIVLATCTVVAGAIYLRGVQGDYFKAGLKAGIIWMVVNLAIDAPMFSFGPMEMSAVEYLKDIGLTYLVIPVIVGGMGWLLDKKIR